MTTANETIKLSAELREQTGKQAAKLRDAGKVPGVLYGHNIKNLSLSVNLSEFLNVYKTTGENTLIRLQIAGQPKPRVVLIHDVQNHFLSDQPIHVDFYEVKMSEKLKTKVPIVFSGEAKAVKDLGGILLKNISEVEVESLPGDLPHSFEVNLGKLKTFEDSITISDLKADASKVKILAKPEDIIAKVAPPRSEEELKSLEEKPVEEVSSVEGVVKETPVKEGEGEDKNKEAKVEKKPAE